MAEYKTAENIRAQGRERQTRFRKTRRRIEIILNPETQNDIIDYLTTQEKKPAELIAELIREKIKPKAE